MSYSSSAASNTHLFWEIPSEVFHCQIFIHFDYSWVYRVFRLICKRSDSMVTRSTTHSFGNELTVFLDNNIHRTRSFVNCCEKGYFQHLKALIIRGGQELSQLSKEMDLYFYDDDDDDSVQRSDHYLNCFPNLQQLQLDRSYFDDSIVTGIVHCQNLQNLTHLDLFSAQIHDKSVSLIASSPLLSNLTCLCMNQMIGKASLKDLCSSPYMSNLKDLQLCSCKIGDDGVQEVSQSTTLKHLTALSLPGNDISIVGAKLIGHSSVFRNLTSLNLNSNNISMEGMEYLASCEQLSNLEQLAMGYNAQHTGIPFQVIIAIFNGPMKNIKSISLSPNSDSEFEQFISCKNIASLRSLDMSFCSTFSNHGLELLANCPNLSQLEQLRISFTHVTDIMPLINSEYMKNIRELNVSGRGINSSTLIALSQALPKLKDLDINGQDNISMDGILRSLDHLKHLQALSMPSFHSVSREQVEQFASHVVASKLIYLTFTNEHGFIPIFFGEHSRFENLTYLNIRGQPLSIEDAQVLTSTPKLCELRYLYLPRGHDITSRKQNKQIVSMLMKSLYLYKINNGEREHLESMFY